jgi:hypothetical protein
MKRFAILFLLFASPLAAQVKPAPVCDGSLWTHVYHPQRLKTKQGCTVVTGILVDATKGKQKDGCRHEADGDSHCFLKVDPGQEGVLLPGNISAQEGNLVVELICRYPVTQADAVASCRNFKSKVLLPPIGSHVKITGSLIEDLDHKPIHRELHPVTSIEVLR